MEQFLNLFLIVLGVGGFALAFYIHKSKKKQKPIACPMDGHCDEVVRSEYSKFFGIPVEILGMVYYAAVAVIYGASLYLFSAPPFMSFASLFLTTGAFLFSLYLTFIQAFNLKQWCTWCLISAGICSFVFVASLFSIKFGLIAIPLEIFEQISGALSAVHLLGTAMGVGSSVVSLVILVKFGRDMDISRTESDIIHLLSEILWFSLAVIVLTGFGLYLSDSAMPAYPSVFWLKTFAILFLMGLGVFFNLVALPKAIKEAVGGEQATNNLSKEEIQRLLSMSMMSVASIFFIFILTAFAGTVSGYGFANLSVILVITLAVFASAGRRLGKNISLDRSN